MKAEYVNHMGSDLTVVNSARVSFNKHKETFNDNDKKLILYLANHNHWTPFSHCQITLRETVPIFVARQRFKHTVGFSYNEVSRRYINERPEFFTPSLWRKAANNRKQGSSDQGIERQDFVNKEYAEFLNLCETIYKLMLVEGVSPEQARMVLPQSMYTSYYVTGSLAAWARAYNLRIDHHAQKEIQYLAAEWDKIIRPLYPVSWAALVDKDKENEKDL